MKMRKLLPVMLLLYVCLLSGCGRYEQIRVVSGKVVTVMFGGLRSISMDVDVEVDNPAGRIRVDKVDGELKHSGKVLGRVGLDPFVLTPRSVEVHHLKAKVDMADGVGLRDLMFLMDMKNLETCTVDVNVKGKVAGVKVSRRYRDIPLKKLLENKKNEKI